MNTFDAVFLVAAGLVLVMPGAELRAQDPDAPRPVASGS
jgi:hypothetical protein